MLSVSLMQKKSSRPAISHAVKLQLIIGHDLPKLGDVKGCQPSAAGNKDRFCRLAATQLVLFVLLHGETIWLALFQPREHIVHGVHKVIVILLDLHPGNHVHQRVHVPILGGALKDDIGDKRTIQKCFGLRPKRIALLALSLGVGDQRIDKL